MSWLSWGHHGRELFVSIHSTQISRILNYKVRAELRVGHVGVDALGTTTPLALARTPPLGFKGLSGAVPAHLERLEGFHIGRRGPAPNFS